MSYYAKRRYNPPADVYAASTLVGCRPNKAAKAQWFADTERLILAQRPEISGRIVWAELEYLQLLLKAPLDAAAVYLARHDELAKPYN